RLSSTTLTLSRLRPDEAAPNSPPMPASNVEFWVATFAPQLAMVHRQVLRMLGFEPQGAVIPGAPTEAGITNPQALARLEVLGALHLIYTAAGAAAPDSAPANR